MHGPTCAAILNIGFPLLFIDTARGWEQKLCYLIRLLLGDHCRCCMARDVDKIHSKPWRIYTLLALICASIPFTSLVFSLAFSNSNKQPIFFSTSINGTSLEFGVAGYCVVDENNTKTCSSWWSGELKSRVHFRLQFPIVEGHSFLTCCPIL